MCSRGARHSSDYTPRAELVHSKLLRLELPSPLCAGDKDASEQDKLGDEGILVRQVLAAADKKTWLGPAGYALARDSKWGDLWPSYYIDKAIIQKIESKS